MLCVLDQCEFLSKKTRKKKINLWKLSKVALLLNQFLFEVFTLPYFKYLLSVFVQYARAFLNSYTQSVCVSCSAMSDSLWPHGLNPPPVRRILQARILVWIAMLSSRGFSQPRDWSRTSYILYWQADSLLSEPPVKPSLIPYLHSVCCSLRNFWFHKCDEGARRLLWNSQRGLYLHICT